ncbi:aminotransferase class-III family protein [Mycobacteroides abscessus MAB_110811_1470]|nr:aminotransferase class-III family protein [Mycobacteroides abscessus MAB_110811_1470]
MTSDAYHGNTAAVTAISPSLGGNSLGAHVRTVAPPDSYRTPPGELAERFAADVSHAIDELCAAGYGFSCLVVDTIFSSDGIYPDASVLEPAAEVVRAAGGVLIADEVQPGFGRTGEAWWGFIRHGVVPDLVTMGKPMANGMPRCWNRRRRWCAPRRVLIADEVQPGFGRTGEAWWGFIRHGVVPDLVTMGKPMANGIPVSALAATSEVLAPFAQDVRISTPSGEIRYRWPRPRPSWT